LKDITNSPLHSWEFSDYFLQFARLSISIDENRTEGIAILRQIFDIVFKYDQFNSGRVFELERIIDVYLEEIFPDVTGYDKNLTDEISGAYFMRGLCAMKNKNFGTAFKFLVCVSDNDKSLLSRKYGISVESIIKRVLKETNHIPTDKQFNLFERKVFENNIYGKQNHETLPNLCTEKSKIYSVIGDFR
ncbi:hypothetical protein K8R66_04290, partial [bacterium]|nr:hypothetical protein [bacterium]